MPDELGYKFEGLFEEDGMTSINQTPDHTLITNASGELLTNEGVAIQAMEWQDRSKTNNKKIFFFI